MSDFLKSLANQLTSQFSIGENTTHSLDKVIDGQTVKYGALGDFASKIDQSAERKYLEQGFLRRGSTGVDTKQFEILMQEPTATVLVKKRMFSSLAENYRPEFMNADERMYYKSVKVLLQNKCREISAFEKLSKIEKITSMMGSVPDQLMPIIFTLSDSFSEVKTDVAKESANFINSGGSSNSTSVASFQQVIGRIRRLYAFNQSTITTNWITDSSNVLTSNFGEGTGVIELTNFTSITTTTNLGGNGTCNVTITDPYGVMVVTDYDIEKAISDATNLFNNHKTFQFGQDAIEQVITNLQSRFTSLRSKRQASPITFKINPDTILSKRLIAIIEKTGTEIIFEYNPLSQDNINFNIDNKNVNIDFLVPNTSADSGVKVSAEYLENGAVAGYDGLSTVSFSNQDGPVKYFPESELILFQQLVNAIFSKIALDANSRNVLQQANKDTNYTRQKLRFNFLGKCIVQPMDSVHVYINSRSKYDNKLLSGLKTMFTGVNFLQAANSTFTNIDKTLNLFNPSELSVQIEKSAFVGPDFPNYLWYLLREQFVTEKEGTHVFGGLIRSSDHSFNAQSGYSVGFGARDNIEYLTMGKVNFNPSVDAWNGVFYDPLTPYKSKFNAISTNFKNEIPELLPENQAILSSPLLKFKSGPNAGKSVTKDNYVQDVTVDPVTGQFTRTFYAPDGLVYKWKEGIGVFVQFGSSFDLNGPGNTGFPSITTDPLAGQDIMNSISLLITGVPYNFSTYWKSLNNPDAVGRDPESNQDPSVSFFSSFQYDLKKRNSLWGNFIPFKMLNIDEASYKKAFYKLSQIDKKNQLVERKLNELNRLNNIAITANTVASVIQGKAIASGADAAEQELLANETSKISKEINKLLKEIAKDDQSEKNPFTQVGQDVSFNADDFLYKEDEKSILPKTRRFLRRQINFLTRRMSYAVRANEDKNLFIVDDFYDKDFDIEAFNSAIANGMKLYENNFVDVKDKVQNVANLLNLEVFCDSQGHIRARPPQYNRMPSSVFYRMMYNKKAFGIRVFPEFLDELFNDQLTALRERLEIVEDYIRLDCAVLGFLSDDLATNFINGNTVSSNQGAPFAFISNPDGFIPEVKDILAQANPDTNLGQNNVSFGQIGQQATSTKDLFTSASRFAFIKKVLDAEAAEEQLADNGFNLFDPVDFDKNNLLNEIRIRIESKSGEKIVASSFNYSANPANVLSLDKTISVDIFKVTKDLGTKLAERQKAIKLFYNALKNSKEFKSLDEDDSVANKLLVQGNYGSDDIPEVFEHMIEDESFDDFGPGSGQRYVIKNSQITSFNFSENVPQYTQVEVQGTLNKFNPTALPTGLTSFPSGGNALTTARAIDYDLWRNYGIMNGQPVSVPFLTDPQSQCAPYAVSLLSRARANILTGRVDLVGNEYYQPGEVVFIEDKNLLFYVDTVTHTFQQGSNFTTNLSLTYGHAPGEYIPTSLDIIGKLLYNNKDIATNQVQRQDSAFNDANYGVIVFDPKNKTYSQESKDGNLGGPTWGPSNATVINNLLFNVSYLIYTQNGEGTNVKSSVELRVYYDGNYTKSPNAALLGFADLASKILLGDSTLNDQLAKNNNNKKPITFPQGSVKIVPVDISKSGEYRSPSAKAMSMARNLQNQAGAIPEDSNKPGGNDSSNNSINQAKKLNVNTSNVIKSEKDPLRKALFNYVVDCWVKLETLPPEKKNG